MAENTAHESERDAMARRLIAIFGPSLDRQIENIEYHRDRNTGIGRPEQYELFLRAKVLRDQDSDAERTLAELAERQGEPNGLKGVL